MPTHKHRQETAQDVREGRTVEQRRGPKTLTMGIWTALRDRAHSRIGKEFGRQALKRWGVGGGGMLQEWEDRALADVPAPVFLRKQASVHCGLCA